MCNTIHVSQEIEGSKRRGIKREARKREGITRVGREEVSVLPRVTAAVSRGRERVLPLSLLAHSWSAPSRHTWERSLKAVCPSRPCVPQGTHTRKAHALIATTSTQLSRHTSSITLSLYLSIFLFQGQFCPILNTDSWPRTRGMLSRFK